jgi:hypothetical protein
MAKPKGSPKTGGRQPGSPNKATKEAREAIALFVNDNAHRLQDWLDRVAIDDPEKAFSLFQSVIEYHVPKLARTETSGPDGGPQRHSISWEK